MKVLNQLNFWSFQPRRRRMTSILSNSRFVRTAALCLIGVKGLLWVNYPLNGVTNDTVRIGLVTDAPPDRRLRVFCANNGPSLRLQRITGMSPTQPLPIRVACARGVESVAAIQNSMRRRGKNCGRSSYCLSRSALCRCSVLIECLFEQAEFA